MSSIGDGMAPATLKAGRKQSPFMDLTSEQGILGLTMLQQRLKRAEMGERYEFYQLHQDFP